MNVRAQQSTMLSSRRLALSSPRPFVSTRAGAFFCRRPRTLCRAQEVDLEAEVEAFMKRQAELESGAAFARVKDPSAVIGADAVSEDEAKEFCADVFEILRMLKRTRDMSVNEVRLVVSIEDPRTRERRSTMDMESESGVSRDEMAVALMEVAEGRVPKDRIALKCLHEEITGWPFLESAKAEEQAMDDAIAAKGEKPAESASPYDILKDGDTVVKPYVMGKEARRGDKPQGIEDMLPDWVGFGALYGISALPVLFVVVTVLVLFWNSLK